MAKKADELLTTAQAAAFMNYDTIASMRSAARFARNRGIELRADPSLWPDKRTPMYSKDALTRYRDVDRPNRTWSAKAAKPAAGSTAKKTTAAKDTSAKAAGVKGKGAKTAAAKEKVAS